MVMTSHLGSTRHPLLAGVDALTQALEVAATGNPVFLSTAEKAQVLRSLAQAKEQVEGLLLGVLTATEDVAAEAGARSASAWLGHQTRADYGPSARQGRLADALDARWLQVGAALVEGRMSVAQAEVVVAALDALPKEVPGEVLTKAEAHLVDLAAQHTPRELRRLGRRVLEVVAPQAFDDEERRLLECEEALARRRTFLSMRDNGDGTTDLKGRVPDSVADRLRTYLEAHTAPRRTTKDDETVSPIGLAGAGDRRLYPQRLGEAFCSLLEHLPADLLPVHGGTATTLIVTIGLDDLAQGVGCGDLATGGRISVGEARRLACTAGIVPAVLGGKSEPLDLGRARRLFSGAQRKALVIRDRQCRAEGCTIPAAWCEAHHAGQPWAHGGRTDLAEGVLLCSWHHHRAHDPPTSTGDSPTET